MWLFALPQLLREGGIEALIEDTTEAGKDFELSRFLPENNFSLPRHL